jgi:hypothetical protein
MKVTRGTIDVIPCQEKRKSHVSFWIGQEITKLSVQRSLTEINTFIVRRNQQQFK